MVKNIYPNFLEHYSQNSFPKIFYKFWDTNEPNRRFSERCFLLLPLLFILH